MVVFVNCRANSVTWNPHKMMSVPLQCSALLVREEVRLSSFKWMSSSHTIDVHFCFIGLIINTPHFMSWQGLMQNCNQMHACYLFQQDKHYDLSYDTGDKALQCGRHVDIFKLWLMWRAKVICSLVHIFVPFFYFHLLPKLIYRNLCGVQKILCKTVNCLLFKCWVFKLITLLLHLLWFLFLTYFSNIICIHYACTLQMCQDAYINANFAHFASDYSAEKFLSLLYTVVQMPSI